MRHLNVRNAYLFQAWLGGNPAKPIVNDAAKQCFACHAPKSANDYVFSTYLQ